MYDIVTDHGTVRLYKRVSVRLTQNTPQSHSSILDKNGMSVSLTTTVNLVFGSGVLDPVTGVILNDEVGVVFY